GRSGERVHDLARVGGGRVGGAASAGLFALSAGCAAALGCSRPDVARRLSRALPAGGRKLGELALVRSFIALPALPAAAAPARLAPVLAEDQPVVRAPQAVAPTTV